MNDHEEETNAQATALSSNKRTHRSQRDLAENISSQASLALSSGSTWRRYTGRRVTRSVAHLMDILMPATVGPNITGNLSALMFSPVEH